MEWNFSWLALVDELVGYGAEPIYRRQTHSMKALNLSFHLLSLLSICVCPSEESQLEFVLMNNES